MEVSTEIKPFSAQRCLVCFSSLDSHIALLVLIRKEEKKGNSILITVGVWLPNLFKIVSTGVNGWGKAGVSKVCRISFDLPGDLLSRCSPVMLWGKEKLCNADELFIQSELTTSSRKEATPQCALSFLDGNSEFSMKSVILVDFAELFCILDV